MYSFAFSRSLFLTLQLADFGLSNHFQRGALLQTYCGSPLYAAPEIVKGLPYQGPEVGQHTDLKTCSQTLWVLVCLVCCLYLITQFNTHDAHSKSSKQVGAVFD